jgi:hypothetical protein
MVVVSGVERRRSQTHEQQGWFSQGMCTILWTKLRIINLIFQHLRKAGWECSTVSITGYHSAGHQTFHPHPPTTE